MAQQAEGDDPGATCYGSCGDTHTAQLWGRLYRSAPFQEKILAASGILKASRGDSRTSVWLFHWLTSKKKAVLPSEGMELLCELLRSLPAEYVLRKHMPFLAAQFRAVVRNAEARKDGSLESLDVGPAAQDDTHDTVEEQAQSKTQRGQSTFDFTHVRLLSLLVQRASTVRPTLEQTLPLFRAVVGLLSGQAAKDVRIGQDGSPLALASMEAAHLLVYALQDASPKKGFRSLLAALPEVVALVAASSPVASTPAPPPSSGQRSPWAPARLLTRNLFDRRHIEGFEMLAKEPDSEKSLMHQVEPSTKRVRSDRKETAAAGLFVTHQAGLFTLVRELLLKPGDASRHMAEFLPLLFADFVASYRHHVEYREAAPLDPGGTYESAGFGRKRGAPRQAMPVPCEFWFFLQLHHVLRFALKQCVGSDGGEASEAIPLVRCLVDLWGCVRELGIYRPREDSRLVQAKTLDGFCKLMLRRVSAKKPAKAKDAVEWRGLLEALALDPSPFDSRLDEVWLVVTDLCPKTASADAAKLDEGSHGASRLAVALLQSYARMADLASCMASLVKALHNKPGQRALRLVRDRIFLRGVGAVATDVSEGSLLQATRTWEALLKDLTREGVQQGSFSWVALLLQCFIEGIHPTELSLARIRELLLETFVALDHYRDGSSVGDTAPDGEVADGLALALCTLGRRVLAWDLPSALRPLSGKAAELAQRMTRVLAILARRFAKGRQVPDSSCELYIRASVMWLALSKQEATPNRALEAKVLVSVLQLSGVESSEDAAPSIATQISARSTVCTWLPLFASLARRSSEEARGSDAKDDHLSLLVGICVPHELACWRFVAQCWEGKCLDIAAETRDKVWGPAAQIWVRQAETAVLDPVPLRVPVIRRVTELMESALEVPVAATERGLKRRVSGLVGLQGALLRVSRASSRWLDAALLVSVFRIAVRCVTFACTACRQAAPEDFLGDSSAGAEVHPLARLLVAGLRCLGQLVGRVEDPTVRCELVALLTGQPGEERSVTLTVCEIVAGGRLGRAWLETGRALAALIHALLRWPVDARLASGRARWLATAQWLATVLAELVGHGLTSSLVADSEDETPSVCRIMLPHPVALLCRRECQSSASLHRTEQSLQLLLAVFDGLPSSKDLAKAALLAVVRVVLGVGPALAEVEEQQVKPPDRTALACAGLVLAILARSVELCQEGGLVETVATNGDGCSTGGTARDKRVELIGVAPRIVRWVVARPEALVSWPGAEQLRDGAGRFVQAWCGLSSRLEGDELWREIWVPLVVEWVLVLASSSRSAADIVAASAEHQSLTSGCFMALTEYAPRRRCEFLLQCLTRRASGLALCAASASDAGCVALLVSLVSNVAVVIQRAPKRTTLRPLATRPVLELVRTAAGLCEAVLQPGGRGMDARGHVSLSLGVATVVLHLYNHLAASLQGAARLDRVPLRQLSEAELLLLRMASQQIRVALRLDGSDLGASITDLLRSSHRLLLAMFGAVPEEGKTLPFWMCRPHLVEDALRLCLEAVYAAPSGAQAASLADDLARLWEAYALGSTRKIAQSTSRSGRKTYLAKIQRATRYHVMFLVSHALEQQRRWQGVDASVKQSLSRLEPGARAGARIGEVARWKEVVSILQGGMATLLNSLEGADYLKQCMYSGLREPLNAMFKELNDGYQTRLRYKGEA